MTKTSSSLSSILHVCHCLNSIFQIIFLFLSLLPSLFLLCWILGLSLFRASFGCLSSLVFISICYKSLLHISLSLGIWCSEWRNLFRWIHNFLEKISSVHISLLRFCNIAISVFNLGIRPRVVKHRIILCQLFSLSQQCSLYIGYILKHDLSKEFVIFKIFHVWEKISFANALVTVHIE